ncbi:TSUP family transporter [Bacillus velezensis]|nr:TSUP family transporter [Bacillus velezensis]
MTPLLIVLGINPSIAVGTDLYITPSPNCSVSFLIGASTVQFKLVGYLALGSIPSATAAIGVLHLFPAFHQHQEQIIKQALGYVLTLVAISIIARLFSIKDCGRTAGDKKRLKKSGHS